MSVCLVSYILSLTWNMRKRYPDIISLKKYRTTALVDLSIIPRNFRFSIYLYISKHIIVFVSGKVLGAKVAILRGELSTLQSRRKLFGTVGNMGNQRKMGQLNHKSSPSVENANLNESRTEWHFYISQTSLLRYTVVLGLNAGFHLFLCTLMFRRKSYRWSFWCCKTTNTNKTNSILVKRKSELID